MSAVSAPSPTRLDVEQFHKMAEVGVIAPDARVELLDGELWTMAPIGDPHIWAASVLTRLLLRHPVGDRIFVSAPGAARLSRWTELYPDILVAKARPGGYAKSSPGIAEILLVIEVADSSARHDTTRKVDTYARHGVAEVWVLDINAQALRVFRRSAGERYLDAVVIEQDVDVSPLAMPELGLRWYEAIRPSDA